MSPSDDPLQAAREAAARTEAARMDREALAALVRLLPPLDLAWPEEWQARWWRWWEFLWNEAAAARRAGEERDG